MAVQLDLIARGEERQLLRDHTQVRIGVVAPGADSARLVTLLQAAERDLRTAALALAGRLTASTSVATARDPLEPRLHDRLATHPAGIIARTMT